MTTTLWDHLLVAVLVLVVPAYGRASYKKLSSRIAAGDRGARLVEYRWTIALQWGLAALVAVPWLLASRPLDALGVALPAGRHTYIGAAITAAGLGLLALQWRVIQRLDAQGLERLRGQLAGAAAVLPTNVAEHRAFRALAVTAGIAEELVYRGYLIWYLSDFIGTWPGAIAAAAAFGLCHFYQGPSGVAKTALAGLLAGALFIGAGSLLWPMILHAALDLQGGAVGRRVAAESSAR